jgi:hypothetical protein
VPISNIIIVSAVLGVVAFNTDLFFNANIGPGRVRLLIGPGVGFSVVAGGGYSGGSIRLPAVIGMEILTRSYGVGFRFMLRPWLEYAIGSSGRTSVTGIGGGALAVFGVSFYGKRDASPAYPAYPPP